MTPDKKQNIYVSPETPEPDRFRFGLNLLMKECERLGVKNAWIVVPMKGTYDGYIAQAIGTEQAKTLSNKKTVTCGDVTIHGHYATRLPPLGDKCPVLAAYLSADSLEAVDALFNVLSLVVVPNAATTASDMDTEEWRAKRQPEVYSIAV